MFVCLTDKQGRAGAGQGKAGQGRAWHARGSLSDRGRGRTGAGQGRAARANTRPLFSVTDRAGQG